MAKKFVLGANVTANLARIQQSADQLVAKECFSIQYLALDDLVRSEKNFYRIEEIEELAEDILHNGLQHNLVVRPAEGGKYELISGERRFTAMLQLVAAGNQQFQHVPCKVEQIDDLIAEEKLISANAQTRALSPAEQLEQVERLKEIYRKRQERGECLPGRLRARIAEKLQISPAQVGKLERLSGQLTETERAAFSAGELNVKTATEAVKAKQVTQKKENTSACPQKIAQDSILQKNNTFNQQNGASHTVAESDNTDASSITRTLQKQIMKSVTEISNAVNALKGLPPASATMEYFETVAGALREIIAELET